MHSTNYYDTFIEVAVDCPVVVAEKPRPKPGKATIASLEYDMLIDSPYKRTSDDVLFEVFAKRQELVRDEYKEERANFFSKGQPCFRSSPLTKRYGWGVHSDNEGKIAIYPVESKEYKNFVSDKNLKHLKAMRSKKA